MSDTQSHPDLSNALKVRMRIHASWYLAFILLIFVNVTQFPGDYPLWQRIAFGTAGIVVFFLTVVLRQFQLNLLAIHMGIPLRNVTLFTFGGATRVPRDTTRPGIELLMAGSGFVFNLIVAGILQWISLREPITSSPLIAALVQWSAFLWYILALFHLVPALPLEGGRILLAILWKSTGNYRIAVRISTSTGWGFGSLFILGGIAVFVFLQEAVNGLLLAFHGCVLLSAATQSRRWAKLYEALHNTRARDIMTREFPAIAPQTSLRQAVTNYSLVTGQDYFPVAEKGKFVGIITLAGINRIPRGEWDSTLVEEAMTPAMKVFTVMADQTATYTIEYMDQTGTHRVPVLDKKDEVIGVVIRDSLMNLARVRTEFRL
ncbi:MAG: CBS domain-containing protein [Dehalococcoidia bacterium]|nr:CBS domain-containing protein [Dehalococcoidia bacterium]